MKEITAKIGLVSASQGFAVVAQVTYLAIASRMVSQQDFAAFAVGAIAATFGVMLVQTSLGRAAARRLNDDVHGDRALVSVAGAFGLLIWLTVALLAVPFGLLWGVQGATAVIVWMSLQVPLAAVSGVQSGILRRQERIHAYAVVQVIGTLVGTATGIVVVVVAPSAVALAMQPLIATLTLVMAYSFLLGTRSAPGRIRRSSIGDLSFSLRAGSVGLLIYVFAALPQWAMSTRLGSTTFANWNRALTVAQVPVDLANRSISTVLYPRFRMHAVGNSATRRAWTGMLAGSSLLLFPLLAVTLPAIGPMVSLVIGSSWIEARAMAPWVLATSVMSLLGSLLANALESSGHFRILVPGYVATIPIFVAGTLLVIVQGTWTPGAISFLVAAVMMHLVQVVGAHRRRLLDGGALFRKYGIALTIFAIVATEAAMVAELYGDVASIVNASVLSAAYLLYAYRRRQLFINAVK